MKKTMMILITAAVMSSVIGGCSSSGTKHGEIDELETFTVVERETVVLDMPTVKEDVYDIPEYYEPQDTYPNYEEETEAWSDTHTTAPVPDENLNGYDYLGAWITADGSSDIYFYEVDGQRYYYGTIYGVYYEGTVEVYESHGAIYCLDGSKTDGTIAVSFYMNYNEANEMNPYELYEQAYGTGFYWHHQ